MSLCAVGSSVDLSPFVHACKTLSRSHSLHVSLSPTLLSLSFSTPLSLSLSLSLSPRLSLSLSPSSPLSLSLSIFTSVSLSLHLHLSLSLSLYPSLPLVYVRRDARMSTSTRAPESLSTSTRVHTRTTCTPTVACQCQCCSGSGACREAITYPSSAQVCGRCRVSTDVAPHFVSVPPSAESFCRNPASAGRAGRTGVCTGRPKESGCFV